MAGTSDVVDLAQGNRRRLQERPIREDQIDDYILESDSSIHIQYPNIPEEFVGTNKTVETLKGPKRKQMKESL
ncbi:hypothetical protein N7467_003126 [Penicillium canescens]|nr:hypothetical protein N7467_003126 [Penicillium canescens]